MDWVKGIFLCSKAPYFIGKIHGVLLRFSLKSSDIHPQICEFVRLPPLMPGSPAAFWSLAQLSLAARRVAKVALGDESGEGGGVGAAVLLLKSHIDVV